VEDDGSAPQLTALEGPLPPGDIFGLYRSARQARTALTKLARDQKLCLRVLGLEPGGDGSCFGHQVGRCAGACVGAEPRLKHNLRLKLALAPHKLRSWPYKGAVALEETSAMGLKQWHVLDGWQYLGSVQPDEVDPVEATRVGLAKPQAGFDPDVYRILARHLTRTRKGLRPWPPSDRP
jgi:DNA polymerase-3 subunit epsilon